MYMLYVIIKDRKKCIKITFDLLLYKYSLEGQRREFVIPDSATISAFFVCFEFVRMRGGRGDLN